MPQLFEMTKLPSRLIALLILLIIPLAFFFYYKNKIDAIPKHAKQIAAYWDAPSFTYEAQNGKMFSSDSLKGSVYVANFFYAQCPNVCMDLSKSMAQLQQNFIDNPEIKLVSFTIDPLRDSIPVLKAYATRYGAVAGKWYFLRGDTATIWNTIEKGFKVSVGYARDTSAVGYTFTHTQKLVLVDAEGKIRGFYDGMDPAEMDSLYNNIGSLLASENLQR